MEGAKDGSKRVKCGNWGRGRGIGLDAKRGRVGRGQWGVKSLRAKEKLTESFWVLASLPSGGGHDFRFSVEMRGEDGRGLLRDRVMIQVPRDWRGIKKLHGISSGKGGRGLVGGSGRGGGR